jgi:hypothetical protein
MSAGRAIWKYVKGDSMMNFTEGCDDGSGLVWALLLTVLNLWILPPEC